VDVRELGLSGNNPVIKVDHSYFGWNVTNGAGRLQQILGGISTDPDSLAPVESTLGIDISHENSDKNCF
jgi:hypothetical protein